MFNRPASILVSILSKSYLDLIIASLLDQFTIEAV